MTTAPHPHRAGPPAAGCRTALLLAPLLLLVAGPLRADSDATVIQRGLLPEKDGRWGLGVGLRMEETPYRGQSAVTDLLPLLSYEGSRAYLRGTRGGFVLVDRERFKLEAIGQFRLTRYTGEGGTYLAGMLREQSFDVGLNAIFPTSFGEFSAEALTDASNTHKGEELSLGWARTFSSGRLRWRPSLSLNRFSKNLADYYYGVQPGEARPDRPAYTVGPSTNLRLGVHASWQLTPNGYLYGSVGGNRFDDEIGQSPIVHRQFMFTAFAGYLYRFGNGSGPAETDNVGPLTGDGRWSLRVARGWNAEASLLGIIPGGDLTLSPERTGVWSVELGKLLDERFMGWPVDIWVKGAYKRYLEQGLQPDFNGGALYIKAFYHFPWSNYVKTRFGFGEGLSYVEQIPFLERQSIEKKNPNTSKLLNYLDVSIDVSVGDLLRVKPLENTFLGFAVIHRSGVFGFSDLFGAVDGGSNYNSVYVETLF